MKASPSFTTNGDGQGFSLSARRVSQPIPASRFPERTRRQFILSESLFKTPAPRDHSIYIPELHEVAPDQGLHQ